MIDIFKAATGEPDHKAIFDWLSPSLEPAAGTLGAPSWGGPDSAPSPTAQAFDIATGAITADSIAARVITGDKMVAHTLTADEIAADYVVANVANIGNTVQIDSTGERITGGSLTVTNPVGTVIIDGSSNMFKIAVSDTIFTAAGPNNGFVDHVVDYPTGLTSPPAHQSYCGFTFGQLPYISLSALDLTKVADQITLHTEVISTNQTRVTVRWTSAYDRSALAWSVHHFIFKETSI